MLVDIFRTVDFLKVIAITGGPCGGKSTFLKMAIKLLLDCGFKVIVVPEVARELIAAGIVPTGIWNSTKDFQKHVLFSVLQKEALYVKAVKDMDLKGQKVVFFCDRGAIDGAAYCGHENFVELLEELGLTYAKLLERYDLVIHLVTAAIDAEEYYVMDDERHETPEQAAKLDLLTRKAWHLHRHFRLIDNSTSFALKISKALNALKRILPMPTPLEIESKFLLKEFKPNMLPEGTSSYDIVQTYLDRPDRPGIECRVRKKITHGTATYYYTEKIDEGIPGQRYETPDEQLTEEEYLSLIKRFGRKDWKTIKKTRYKIPYGELLIELDVFHNIGFEDHCTAEVEFRTAEEQATFIFPNMFGAYLDITLNKAYSNSSMAKYGLPVAA